MGIETIVPLFALLVGYLVWRLFSKRERPQGTPTTDSHPRKRPPHDL